MAPLALDRIPIELIEIIVEFLGFQDLCALRLTARSISGKSSNGRFRENFKSKTLHIAKAPLEDFARVTQPGQQLTLQHYAVPNPGDSDGCFGLLVQGMENLRINTSHGCLVSLSLSLRGIKDSEYEGYDAAAKLFEHSMLALSNSKLPVQMLDIFAKDYPRGCALACGEIMAVVEKTDLSSSFRGCKNYV
ncbi:hypothetical protein BDV23DRAFT_188046 [Aspergillus alliaceus]|uniref:F-box domain-containing protein n=1 Tax=Petromyces alliaceus TaxID=209559 RepID=A0A5N7BV17_PETAA|nr:hypothetical protein BDV23DRAFT_188046 [Aspergillus alliaceus]